MFSDRCCFALGQKPPIQSGVLNLFLIRTQSSSVASFVMRRSVFIYVCCCVMEVYECSNEPLGSIICTKFLKGIRLSREHVELYSVVQCIMIKCI